jgi:hypothetical protein
MAAVNNSKRLLIASRLTHQLWRAQHPGIDLARLLGDEAFARDLISAVRTSNTDTQIGALMNEFEKLSIENGAWSTELAPSAPSYARNPDGSIPATAAWDPRYIPPESTANPDAPSIVHKPAQSPRMGAVVAKERGSSGLLSRFGLSRPHESKSTQTPSPGQPDTPIDPNLKKYIRGAR